MILNVNEWNRLYSIEEKVDTLSYTQDDVKFLISTIRKYNGNVIDPRTHNKIQSMIDREDIPEVDIDFNEESKQAIIDLIHKHYGK